MSRDDPLGCADVHELVWLAIDEELSEAERATLDAHLLHCASCRSKIEQARRNAAALRELPAPAVPDGFAERTLARLEPAPILRLRPRLAAFAAAAVVLALAGFWLATRGTEEEREDVALGPGATPAAAAPSKSDALEAGRALSADAPAPAPDVALPEAELKQTNEAGRAKAEADRSEAEDAVRKGEEAPRDRAGDKKLEDRRYAGGEDAKDADKEADFDAGERRAQREAEANEVAAPAAAEALATLRLRTAPIARDDAPPDEKPATQLEGLTKSKEAPAGPERQRGAVPGRTVLPRVEFLIARGGPPLEEWLRARPQAATEDRMAVVDVTERELAALLSRLAEAGAEPERLDDATWIERVARSREAGVRLGAAEKRRAAPEKPAAAPTAPSPPPRERAEPPPALLDEPAARDALVRVVLWLDPPAPAGERR